MIQKLFRSWWLLALCGILEAIYAAMNLFGYNSDGILTWREFAPMSTVRLMGKFALAAAICTIVAGVWNSGKGRSWLLVLYGLALGAIGLISMFFRGKMSFLPVAMLLAIMAVSIGMFAILTARTLDRHISDKWFLRVAGAVALGFALAFFALGFNWVRLGPTTYLPWMSTYFGFSAMCMLALGLRRSY